MIKEITAFLKSLKLTNWLRIGMTIVLTTASLMIAYEGRVTPTLLVGFNLVTLCGVFYMEYKNYKAQS